MRYWDCKIGTTGTLDSEPFLRMAADAPLREAVEAAYRATTGERAEFVFSGWGNFYLPESYLAVVEGRQLTPAYEHCYERASKIVDGLGADTSTTIATAKRARAVSAVADFLYDGHSDLIDAAIDEAVTDGR